MHQIDQFIFFAYLLIVLGMGIYFSRRKRKANEYFLAGRTMHWFPLGLSIMVTSFSGINYTAFSGEVFGHGLYVLLCLPVFVMISYPVTKFIMPFYHRLQITSAYEYLELRFNLKLRLLGSGLFILWHFFWMATVLYIPAKILSVITGYPLYYFVILAGILSTFYTTIGGIRAVIWTDVLQFTVLFGGLFITLFIFMRDVPGGFVEIFTIAKNGGVLKPFAPFDPQIFSLNPFIRITLWSCWIGTFTAFFARYGVDQVVVQRYFTAKSLKTAQRGFRLNYISAVISLSALAVLGISIYVFASNHNLLGKLGGKPLAYFSTFVKSMPVGIPGLIIAGLFAATMSSLDSGINSCVTAFRTDFSNRLGWFRHTNGTGLNLLLAAAIGLIATIASLFIGKLGSIFEIANKAINGLGAPLLAIFILAAFSKKVNNSGMLLGGVAGIFCSFLVTVLIKGLALHYYAVINLLITFLLCLFLSWLIKIIGRKNESGNHNYLWRPVMNGRNRT